MKRLIKAYLTFCMDEVFDTSYYGSGKYGDWTTDRIIGATLLAFAITLGATLITGLLLLWLVNAPVWFLGLFVLPIVTVVGTYKVFKSVANELSKDDE